MIQSNPTGQLIFRVVEGEKECRIYSNGQIEGFGEPAIVINYFDFSSGHSNPKLRASPADRLMRFSIVGDGGPSHGTAAYSSIRPFAMRIVSGDK